MVPSKCHINLIWFIDITYFSNSLRSEQKRSPSTQDVLSFVAQFLASAIFGYVIYFMVITRVIIIDGGIQSNELVDMISILNFCSKYWVGHSMILGIAIYNVIIKRVITWSINPLYDNDHSLDIANRILRNTCEQVLFSIVTQLAIIPHLHGHEIVIYIPLINLLWFVGRIFYTIGYPNYRIFGWGMSFYPHLATSIFAGHLFVKHHLKLY